MSDRHPRFLATELPERTAGECLFHVIPVPYEGTVSYGTGTARGPGAVMEASRQLELWTGRSDPSARGIHTWPAVDCSGDAVAVLGRIEAAVRRALDTGRAGEARDAVNGHGGTPGPRPAVVPVVVGGEHSVSLGAFRALQPIYGRFGILHFDAHADLRNSYEGSPYSHACVMRRAVDDLDLPLFQVGVRSLCAEERDVRAARNIGCLDARDAAFSPAPAGGMPQQRGRAAALAALPCDFPDAVYLSFDLDAFDASLMPATGTPEPGGLFWWDALALIRLCLAGRTCIGFDVVELAPIPGMHAPDYTAARLVYEIMGIVADAPQ